MFLSPVVSNCRKVVELPRLAGEPRPVILDSMAAKSAQTRRAPGQRRTPRARSADDLQRIAPARQLWRSPAISASISEDGQLAVVARQVVQLRSDRAPASGAGTVDAQRATNAVIAGSANSNSFLYFRVRRRRRAGGGPAARARSHPVDAPGRPRPSAYRASRILAAGIDRLHDSSAPGRHS